jgi:hypothetical protein
MTLPQQKDKLKSKNLLPRVTHEALQVFALVSRNCWFHFLSFIPV